MEVQTRVIRIVIADEQRIYREGLARLLGDHAALKVVGAAGTEEELLEVLNTGRPDLLILDLTFPVFEGIERIARIRSLHPSLKTLVITMHSSVHTAVRALRAGANGFLTKDSSATDVVSAIEIIFRGTRYICPSIAEKLALGAQGEATEDTAHERLSEREFKIFEMLVAGKRGAQIASELSLSEKTVSTHKAHLLRKLDLHGSLDLVRYAMRNHLLEE
jgi:DNA-binding NarL/FixJ family response regulator